MFKQCRVSVLVALCFGILSACQANGPAASGATEADFVVMGEHQPHLAPAVLSVPAVIELLAVDGKSTSLNLKQRALKLALTPGEHQLELRYFNLWDLDADDHEIVKSRPILLNVVVKSGRQYAFEAVPAFEAPAQARDFVQSFTPKVVTFKPTVMVASKGGVTDKQKEADIRRTAAMEVVSQVVKSSGAISGSGEKIMNTSAPVSGNSQLEIVQQLWLELSPTERAAFQEWLGEQVGR